MAIKNLRDAEKRAEAMASDERIHEAVILQGNLEHLRNKTRKIEGILFEIWLPLCEEEMRYVLGEGRSILEFFQVSGKDGGKMPLHKRKALMRKIFRFLEKEAENN